MESTLLDTFNEFKKEEIKKLKEDELSVMERDRQLDFDLMPIIKQDQAALIGTLEIAINAYNLLQEKSVINTFFLTLIKTGYKLRDYEIKRSLESVYDENTKQ